MGSTVSTAPDWAQVAQDAIGTPEVQEIIKYLAQFNLAVCMPHAHEVNGEVDTMTPLPAGIVQVERDLRATFVPAAEAVGEDLLPVAWRWENGVTVCAQTCPHDSPSKRKTQTA